MSNSGWKIDVTNVKLYRMEKNVWEQFKAKISNIITVDDFNPMMDCGRWHPMKVPWAGYVRFDSEMFRAYSRPDYARKVIVFEVAGHKNAKQIANMYFKIRESIYNYLLNEVKRLNIRQQRIELSSWGIELDRNEKLYQEDYERAIDLEGYEYNIDV